MIYLASSSERKETRALEIAQANGIEEGLIAVFKCVEPCHTFTVGPHAEKRVLELRSHLGKCSHLYFYSLHPELGLMHLRLQTWAPFTIHVCLNGREWLARRLTREGIGFEQRDNCFVDVDDLLRAQRLLSGQLRTDWTKAMEQLVSERCIGGVLDLVIGWSVCHFTTGVQRWLDARERRRRRIGGF